MAEAVPPVTPPVSLGALPKGDTAGVSMKPALASRFTRGTTPAVIDERSLRRPAERNGRNAT